MASITLNKVWKIYNENKRDEVQAVKDVSIDIHDGEFLCLLGPSGCGKTSTLRMIAGLEDISRGTIRIGTRIVNDLHPSKRDIAMVFESYALYEHLTVFENIAFPLRVQELPNAEIQQRVATAVDILAIGDLLDRMPAHLSDGQKQRVSIGRAIVRQPSAFLMDEPISHLDSILRSRMRREIRHIQQALKTTTVYVTHDQLEATAMADRIAVMHMGELQQLGTPREIFETPATTFVADFVGEPPMNFFEVTLTHSNGDLLLQCEGLTLPVRDARQKAVLEALNHSKVTLGVRPMHLKADLQPDGAAIPAQVYVVEPLDEFNIVTVLVGDQRVLVETPPAVRPDFDQTAWLTFPADHLHLFHPVTGKSLLN